jgi:hypothetical protein
MGGRRARERPQHELDLVERALQSQKDKEFDAFQTPLEEVGSIRSV